MPLASCFGRLGRRSSVVDRVSGYRYEFGWRCCALRRCCLQDNLVLVACNVVVAIKLNADGTRFAVLQRVMFELMFCERKLRPCQRKQYQPFDG